MLPSLSAALAVTVMVAGAVKVAPSAGAVRLTVGGTLGMVTVTLAGKPLPVR